MRPVATDVVHSVVCVSVCLSVLGTQLSCAKTAKPIEMPFGVADLDGSKEPSIDGGPDPLRERGLFMGHMCRPI